MSMNMSVSMFFVYAFEVNGHQNSSIPLSYLNVKNWGKCTCANKYPILVDTNKLKKSLISANQYGTSILCIPTY